MPCQRFDVCWDPKQPTPKPLEHKGIIDVSGRPPTLPGEAKSSSFLASCIRSFRVRILRRILRSASSTTGADVTGSGCEWGKDLEDPMGKWDEPLSFPFLWLVIFISILFSCVSLVGWLDLYDLYPWGLRTWFSSWKSWKVKKDVPSMSSIKGSTLSICHGSQFWRLRMKQTPIYKYDWLFGSFLVAWFASKEQGVWMKAGHLSFRLFQAFAHPHATSNIDQAGSEVTACKRNRSKIVHESKREAKEVQVSRATNPRRSYLLFTPSYFSSLNSLNFRDWMWMDLFKIYPTQAVRQLCQISFPHNNGPIPW